MLGLTLWSQYSEEIDAVDDDGIDYMHGHANYAVPVAVDDEDDA